MVLLFYKEIKNEKKEERDETGDGSQSQRGEVRLDVSLDHLTALSVSSGCCRPVFFCLIC